MALQSTSDRVRNRVRKILATRCSRHQVTLRLNQPVVSFTFDDFPASAYQTGGAILEKYGLNGTYYTSLGLADKVGPVGQYFSESILPELLAHGHELGCHTFDHCHAWRTAPKEYRQSIIRNRERLQEIVPGTVFASHSYPIDYPRPQTKKIAAEYFPSSRGGEQLANHGSADANYLTSFFIEKAWGDFSTIKAAIDQTKASSSWLIFSTHDIRNEHSPFGCSPQLFEAIVKYTKDCSISVLPVSRVYTNLIG